VGRETKSGAQWKMNQQTFTRVSNPRSELQPCSNDPFDPVRTFPASAPTLPPVAEAEADASLSDFTIWCAGRESS
jgi:hypothetical protein